MFSILQGELPSCLALLVSVSYLDAGFQEASVGQKVIVRGLFGNILQNRRLIFLAKGTRRRRKQIFGPEPDSGPKRRERPTYVPESSAY